MAKPTETKKPETSNAAATSAIPAAAPAAPAGPPPGVPALPPLDPLVNIERQSEWTKATARAAYEAYIANSNGLAYDGRPCPPWEKLGVLVQSHWAAAVLGIAALVRQKADVEMAELKERSAAVDESLRLAKEELTALKATAAAAATPLNADRVAELTAELSTCREQLAAELRAHRETTAKLKASTITGDQKAMKLAAERTAMLDVEVTTLREQVRDLEAALRAKS